MKTIKIIFLFFILHSASCISSFAQSLPLPYYTGFDSTSEKAGWQQFRTGILSGNQWSYSPSPFSAFPYSLPYALYHDYNVSGSPTDTVEDWFVSPPLKISTTAKLTLKIFPTAFLTEVGIWLGTGNNNPASGNFTELGYFDLDYTGQWVDTFVNITTITDTGYIAFKYKGTDYNSLVIDNVSITPDSGTMLKNIFTEQTNVFVSPNPFTTTLVIVNEVKQSPSEIFIYDVLGREVKQLIINNQSTIINLQDLPSGIYFYQISDERKKISRGKLVKQ